MGHDNTGRNPEWFLKKLTVEVPSRDETYIFEYNGWIVSEEVEMDPGKELHRLLIRRNSFEKWLKRMWPYTIPVLW